MLGKQSFFSNWKVQVLAGITTSLAVIPDSLAFSFMAGVHPNVGFYTSIIILLVITVLGARGGMISASAGSMAVLMTTLVAGHGLQYLFAATILTGLLQLAMGLLRVGRWMNFVSRAVVTGFINALAIFIFMAQLQNFRGQPWGAFAMAGVTLVIVFLFPRLNKTIPSPLFAVVVMSVAAWAFHIPLQRVSDVAQLSSALPGFGLPQVPLTWETFRVILPYALSLAIVGTTETLLTQDFLDKLTSEKTDKNKEIRGQGIANAASGFFGGMAGCALVAESVLNVKLGGKGRLSMLTAGLFLLSLVLVFGSVLNYIPMSVLAGVMIMICVQIFDWGSLKNIRRIPKSETTIMLTTMVAALLTHDLAIGVFAGVLLNLVLFVVQMSRIHVTSERTGTTLTYAVTGHLFFGSSPMLREKIELPSDETAVTIDLSRASVWDHYAERDIESLLDDFRLQKKSVRLIRKESGAIS
ncbi:SulP family inorganic anion transporter [Cohnella hashimotonis]|uniref:SulP family inorganic anion transporter n=1 Tax=Cohnella hashimotonis TaxID=2826895 RepID=A0ABT6TJR9_9BACL|nr:SulP family inorganic anion transporter [Cohnella hashimotonis]MDI4647091.1 SulP family inorganic anion transporter [Cohnella hashimotonis]